MATIYEYTECVGISTTSIEDAIQNAVDAMKQKGKIISWFEVIAMRGRLTDSGVEHQVTVKFGCVLDS